MAKPKPFYRIAKLVFPDMQYVSLIDEKGNELQRMIFNTEEEYQNIVSNFDRQPRNQLPVFNSASMPPLQIQPIPMLNPTFNMTLPEPSSMVVEFPSVANGGNDYYQSSSEDSMACSPQFDANDIDGLTIVQQGSFDTFNPYDVDFDNPSFGLDNNDIF